MEEKKLIKKLNKEVYPKIADSMDIILPEFDFIQKGKKWISRNTLHLSGNEGKHGVGKVTIHRDKPYAIGDWREGTTNLVNYLIKSNYHSNVKDFESAVKYLAKKGNIELDNDYKNNISDNYKKVIPQYDTIPSKLFKATFLVYQEDFKNLNNNFVQFLNNKFGFEDTNKAIQDYLIGTSKHQFIRRDFPSYQSPKGATIFWQRDITGKFRTGKIMLYDTTTGKRIKKPFSHNTWVHFELKRRRLLKNNFQLQQCLFGEHLMIKYSGKEVAVVESEKTAIIMSILMPEFLWLATGGSTGINKEKFQTLTGKKVILYPDLGQYENWKKKAKSIINCKIKVSKLLENKATENDKKQGYDLADYLLKNQKSIR